MRAWHIRCGISFTVSAGDGQRLRAIIADPKSPQKQQLTETLGKTINSYLGRLNAGFKIDYRQPNYQAQRARRKLPDPYQ